HKEQSVLRVSGVYAVKISAREILAHEAQNMLFLAENSEVRIPKVFAFFSHTNTRKFYYLVTEYIEGQTVDEITWNTLSKEMQSSIGKKISKELSKLRAIPHPNPGYYGRVNGTGWPGNFPLLTSMSPKPCGPYTSYGDLVGAMCTAAGIRAAACSTRFSDDAKLSLACLRKSLQVILEDQKPTLTHQDLKLDNIICKPMLDSGTGRVFDYEVVIIDWEWLGWLPPWCEWASLITR
ncbi:kinase-like domain-containing protein, partial [Clohesyomyces aquaticus]